MTEAVHLGAIPLPITNHPEKSYLDRPKKFCNRMAHILGIIAEEGYTNIRHILPSAIKWAFRRYITSDIVTVNKLQETVGKTTMTAYLSFHGKLPEWKNDQKVAPLLLMHGTFSHPFTTLHLADEAKELAPNKPVFSLWIPKCHDDVHFELQNRLVEQAIGKIEKIIVGRRAKFGGILGVGHSKGAILLAHRQFVDSDKRIKAIFDMAGRLKIAEQDKGKGLCAPVLIPIVERITKGIAENPKLPLVQIVPENDWNASREAIAVRPHDHCHVVPGMHLSGIFKPETRKHFREFVKEFSQ